MDEPPAVLEIVKTEPHAWDRQDDELARMYEGFCHFLDQGIGRTLGNTADYHNIPVNTIRQWSSNHSWTDRAGKYDYFVREERKRLRHKAVEEIEHIHLQIAEKMLQVAESKLDKLMKNTDEATVAEATRMVEAASKLQRLTLGLHGDHTKVEKTSELDSELADIVREINSRKKNAVAEIDDVVEKTWTPQLPQH